MPAGAPRLSTAPRRCRPACAPPLPTAASRTGEAGAPRTVPAAATIARCGGRLAATGRHAGAVHRVVEVNAATRRPTAVPTAARLLKRWAIACAGFFGHANVRLIQRSLRPMARKAESMVRSTSIWALLCGVALAVACAPSPAAPAPTPAGAAAPTVATRPASPSTPAAAAQPATLVRVGYLNSASDAGLLIAVDKGYFAEQGLDVQLERLDSGAVMTAPLAAGQLDIGAGTPSAGLYNAVARNITIKIVADKGSNRAGFGFQGIALRQGLADRVRTYADLRGLKVAMTATGGTSADLLLVAALRKGGLVPSDVDITTIPY